MSESPSPRVDYRGLTALGALLREAAQQRIFLISGLGGRHVERVRAELTGFEIETFSEARRHVPRDLVERAERVLEAFDADAVVTVGGGSATGLGKALRLGRSFFFVAVPTTYAASELTDLYGITSAGGKQTGRDPRVVPDVALYDVELTLDMPLGMSVTSLMNALAHPLSALSTGKLVGTSLERALDAARTVYRALDGLLGDPRGVASRRAAFEGTVLAGQVLRASALGVHHKLAHLLGGGFDLDHAGLHSVLLPHSVAWMKLQVPDVHGVVEHALGDRSLASTLYDFLIRVGAPASLAALGLGEDVFRPWLLAHQELPQALLEAAFSGRRP